MKLTILPLALLAGISAAMPSPLPHASHAASLQQRQDAAVEPIQDTTDALDSFGNPILARALASKRQNWSQDELEVIELCFTDCLIGGGKEEACICECIYAGNCSGGGKGKKGKKI